VDLSDGLFLPQIAGILPLEVLLFGGGLAIRAYYTDFSDFGGLNVA
jgi:hypothetical protein